MHEEPRPDEKQSPDQNLITDPVTTEPSLKPWSLPLSLFFYFSIILKHRAREVTDGSLYNWPD